MTRLILLRHGQSMANKTRLFAGQTDVPLSELGHAQAAAAAAYLLERECIHAVYASDLTRAMETARHTATALSLPIHPEPGLREIFAGEWEMLPYAELKVRYAADRGRWYTDLANAFCTGGESIAQVYDRSIATVKRIAAENDGRTVLIAAHWTPILASICLATGRGLARIGECPEPVNASIHVLRYEDGSLSPEQLNITAHLTDLAGEYCP